MKWLGDGMMFHFRITDDSVIAALEMLKAFSAAELPYCVGLRIPVTEVTNG